MTELFPGVATKLVGTVGVTAEAIPVKQTEMRVVVVNSARNFSAKLRIVALIYRFSNTQRVFNSSVQSIT